MNKVIGVPLDKDNWLEFSLFDDSGLPYVDGTNDDFTIDVLRDGLPVPAHGLTVHHLSAGRYHVTNSGDPATPYKSSSEEQMYIRAWHNIYGGYNLFYFWAMDIDAGAVDLDAVTNELSVLKALILGLY